MIKNTQLKIKLTVKPIAYAFTEIISHRFQTNGLRITYSLQTVER